MGRINVLPKWVLPGTRPSVYDTESGTALEMVAKVYGAMKQLQMDYNAFADEINKTISDFINDTKADYECFKNKINKIMHDYIRMIDDKIKEQDLKIANAVEYMKTNIMVSLEELYKEMYESGEFDEMVLNTFNELDKRFKALDKRVKSLESTDYEIVFSYKNETINIDKDVKEVI